MIIPLSSQLSGSATASTDVEDSGERSKKTLVALVAALIILTTNAFISPDRFADYYSYLLITDRLHYHVDEPVVTYEVLSNLLLLSLRWVTRSTVDSVNLAHEMLGLVFVVFLFGFSQRADVRWQGLIIVLGCFGALLAFITIRATPAYLFITVAALEASKGRLRALLWAAIAILFHVSSFLAIVPLCALLAYTRFDRLHWIQRATTPIVVGGLVYLALFVFFKGAVTTLLDGILSGIPFLNKYIIYTSAEPAQSGIAIDKSSSGSHLAYAVAVSIFTLSCFFVKSEKVVAFRPYILFSYAIFQILEVSPITAYRQSLFWLIPVALVYPWDKFAKGPMWNAAVAAGSFAVFIYSAHTVYN